MTDSFRKYMDPDELLQGDLPDTKHIARLLAALACNSHTICDQEERAIGKLPSCCCPWEHAVKVVWPGDKSICSQA